MTNPLWVNQEWEDLKNFQSLKEEPIQEKEQENHITQCQENLRVREQDQQWEKELLDKISCMLLNLYLISKTLTPWTQMSQL